MTGKYQSYLKTFLKLFFVTGMAVVVPAGCGSENGDDLQKPNPANSVAPTITVLMPETSVFGGAKVEQADSLLLIGGEKVALWKAGSGRIKSVVLAFNDSTISFGTLLSKKGTLSLTVTNDADKSASSKVMLTDEAIMGLGTLVMQVDVEVNLLDSLKFARGVELTKTEIEFDGQRTEIADPAHFIPEYPGLCTLFFSVKKDETVSEVKTENLTINALEYKAMEINNIKPEEILPIIGQIETGDFKVYEHIEHLRLAEATRIRDMMWEYGAGDHSPEEYQQLMMRLNTGMMNENPIGYDNYESIGGALYGKPSNHAHDERNILNTLLNHTNFKIIDPSKDRYEILYKFSNDNKNNINIFGKSTSIEVTKDIYLGAEDTDIKNKLLRLKNLIIFGAGTNIKIGDDGIINKIYQKDIDTDDKHGIYGFPSTAHNKNDNTLDKHLLVTVGTNKDGDVNQTDETHAISRFPVGFHDKVLFSGRAFPYIGANAKNAIVGDYGKYSTSYVNYVNVAMTDLCFQMFAEVKDVDELLEMIRSTALTDYIRFDLNGDGDTNDNINNQPESQPLQLINPAGFFQKYLMPTEVPASISWSQTVALDKGYYHGLVFDIPGAEVKVNGEWIRYNDDNKDLILAQNPFTLEWRLNGNLLRKLGYKQGDTVKGKVIALDDQWNGLSLSTEISVSVTE